jgi:hypothetical protein
VERPAWPPLSGTTDGPLPPELDPLYHRPSDLRAFAIPIIIGILVVVVPLGVYLTTHVGGSTTGNNGGPPPPAPIGTVFAVGFPQEFTCISAFVANNTCVTAGDALYQIHIEASSITFAEVLFQVRNSNGTIFGNTGIGSFALVTAAGEAAAYSDLPAHGGLTMSTTWARYAPGYSGASLLTSTLTILVDLGETTPGTGLSLVAVGVNGCTGTTTPLPLS